MQANKKPILHSRVLSMGAIKLSDSQPRKREQGILAIDPSEQPFSHESHLRQTGSGFKSSTNCYEQDLGIPAEVLGLLQTKDTGLKSSGDVKYFRRETTSPSLFRVSSSSLLTPTTQTTRQHPKDFRALSSASSSKFQPKNVQTKKFIFPSATRLSQGSRQASTPRSSFYSSEFIPDSKQQQEPPKSYPKGLVNFVKQMYKSKIHPWTGTTTSNGFFENSTQTNQSNMNVFVTRIPLQLDFSSQKGSQIKSKQFQGENANDHGGNKTPAKSARDTQVVKSNDTTNVEEGEDTTPLSGRIRISPNRKINLLNQITSRTGSAADTATTPAAAISNQLTAREINSNLDRPSTDRGTYKESMFNGSITPNSQDTQRARYSVRIDSNQNKLSINGNIKSIAENQLINKRMLLQQQIDSVQFHRKVHVNSTDNSKADEVSLLRSKSAMKSQKNRIPPHSTQQLKHTYALFVFINNLGIVKRKSNLQFTITDIPRIYNSIPKSKVEEDFQALKLRVQHNIGLTCRSMYFFRQEGFPIHNHLDFAQIDTNQEAIFFGTQGSFSGLSDIFTEYPGQLQNVIQQLLQKVQYFNNKSEASDQKDHQQSSPTQPSSAGILTKEQICSLHNRREAQKIAQALTFNPEAQLKNFSLVSKRERKLEQFEDLLQAELQQSQENRSIVEMPDSYEREPDKNHTKYNLREIAKYIDDFLDKVEGKKQHSNLEKTSKYQGIERFWNSLRQPPGVNYIQDNISSCLNKTSVLDILQKTNRELFIQNIPKLLNKHELSRHDLHSIYILYKALLSVSVQKDDWRKVLEKGVHFAAFESGIESLSSQGEETIKRMCNYNLFINWESFLAILSSIQGKSLESKINIFLRVSDKDKSGSLSKAEVEELCEICLSKFIPNKKGEDTIVIQLIEYFTRLLFSCLDVDINTEEIPLQKLRDAIINGHPESDLLCFFCGIN